MGWLKVPNDLVDVWLPRLTGAELKVWLFGRRQTVGFNKEHATLSSEQICAGIEKRNGERLNSGTGLSRRAVFQALKGLESKGLATRTPRLGTTNIYTFDVPQPVQKSERVPVQKGEQVGEGEPVHQSARGSAKTAPRPVHQSAPTKDIVGRNLTKDNKKAKTDSTSFEADRRKINGNFQATVADAEALQRLMFDTTGKTETVETALRWLRPARRAEGWWDIEQQLREKLASNRPRNNAWFKTVLQNEFGLSPDDAASQKWEFIQRYREAIRRADHLEAQCCTEEAAKAGIPTTVLMGAI